MAEDGMRDHPVQVNIGSPGLPRRERPDPVVDLLRQILERAERGELRSVAVACETAEHGVSTAFTMGEGAGLFTLVGSVAELKRRLLTETAGDE